MVQNYIEFFLFYILFLFSLPVVRKTHSSPDGGGTGPKTETHFVNANGLFTDSVLVIVMLFCCRYNFVSYLAAFCKHVANMVKSSSVLGVPACFCIKNINV